MKPLPEQNEKNLAYTSPKSFVEQLLSDPYFAIGEIRSDMLTSTFKGVINLNTFTAELQRYLSAKIAYTIKPTNVE